MFPQQLITALFLTQDSEITNTTSYHHGKLLCRMPETQCRYFNIAMRRFDVQTTVHRHLNFAEQAL